MNKLKYTGCWPVAPTPFKENEELDLEGMKRVLDCMIDQKVDGICILANYSEQFLLSDSEREVLTRLCLEHVDGRVPVIVTISHFSTDVVFKRALQAKSLGAGMVMMIEPIDRCIMMLKKNRNYDSIIYLTPDGDKINQKKINSFSTLKNIIMLCGHYKGVDQRVRDHLITDEISIGDFVLSGGVLAATILCDSIIRLIPGVIGDESSALSDSFQDDLLAPPIYTRPAEYNGWKVPKILTSGNILSLI